MIKGILFDKDGTLLDFTATWVPVIRSAAASVAGEAHDKVEELLQIGGFDALEGRVRPDTLLASGNAAEIAQAWGQATAHHHTETLERELDRIFTEEGIARAVPVTDLKALFGRLKDRGLALGVATSDGEAGTLGTLRRFGVLELMDFVAGYDSGFGHKPAPGMVEGFCTATGLAAAHVAMVGDNHHDLEMGRRAGVGLKVGVLTGNSTAEDLAPHADHVLESVAEIERLLG
ncbi:MAG: HAD family hydrolase [Pseudomonadota bacterium]